MKKKERVDPQKKIQTDLFGKRLENISGHKVYIASKKKEEQCYKCRRELKDKFVLEVFFFRKGDKNYEDVKSHAYCEKCYDKIRKIYCDGCERSFYADQIGSPDFLSVNYCKFCWQNHRDIWQEEWRNYKGEEYTDNIDIEKLIENQKKRTKSNY